MSLFRSLAQSTKANQASIPIIPYHIPRTFLSDLYTIFTYVFVCLLAYNLCGHPCKSGALGRQALVLLFDHRYPTTYDWPCHKQGTNEYFLQECFHWYHEEIFAYI